MRFPSQAGVDRIQLPLDAAKKGTFMAPRHWVSQSFLPVWRSNATTVSCDLSRVSVTKTLDPTTIGPE